MNFPHLVERMQLITILTFGEAVISVIRTFPLSQNVWLALVTFACLGAAFINYVSQTAISLEHNQKNSPTLLISAHLVLLMGLNMFTVGIELTTSDLAYLTSPFLVLLGLVIYHLCLLLTSRYNKEELFDPALAITICRVIGSRRRLGLVLPGQHLDLLLCYCPYGVCHDACGLSS